MNTHVRNNLSKLGLLMVLLLSLGACSSVATGQVGVKTDRHGVVKECGVKPGQHWTGFGGMSRFTTRLQNAYMTEGKEGDRTEPDAVNVSSIEGASMSTDIQIGYTLQNNVKSICYIFEQVAKDDAQVKDNIIRPSVRSVATNVFTLYSAKDAKTTKRGEIANKIRDGLNERFQAEPFNGFVNVQSVQIGDVRFPPNIQELVDKAINADSAATTAELQRKADLTKAETELQKSRLSAEQRQIDSTSEADANKRLSDSLSPNLAALKATEACANAIAQTKAQVVTCGGASSGANVLISPGK